MSINPGETISPEASITRVDFSEFILPTLIIVFPVIAISTVLLSVPDPSKTSPFLITKS